MEIVFNSKDGEKIYEDLRNFIRLNDDGTTTEITNNIEVYKGFKVIEREEITKDNRDRIIKKDRRRFGISTTRSADRAFRRAGLSAIDIDSAKAELALVSAKDILTIGSE